LDGAANEFRISRVISVQKELATERDIRAVLAKKFRKALKIVHSLHAFLLFTTSTLTILGTLLTGAFALPLIGTAGGLGGLCLIANEIGRKLSLRLEKHENIRILIESKLNSVNDMISKALDDNSISNVEYSLILGELEKFKIMKEQLRKNTTFAETRGSSIERKNTDFVHSFRKMFGKKNI